MSKPNYIIWDAMDEVVHRGPWTKADCVKWLTDGTDIFGVTQKQIDQVFKIRKFHYNNGYKKFVGGYLLGLTVGAGLVIWGVATGDIEIVFTDNRKKDSGAEVRENL